MIENGDDKDCSFAHTRFGLTEDVLPLECQRDGLDLHFAGMFKSTLSDRSFELIFEEQFIPSCEVSTLIFFVDVLIWFLIV